MLPLVSKPVRLEYGIEQVSHSRMEGVSVESEAEQEIHSLGPTYKRAEA